MLLKKILLKTPGIRSYFKWQNQKYIAQFVEQENRRRREDPKNLMNFESSQFSQNGEDGILAEIFRRIGTTDKFFVEFGIENGKECNCRRLLEADGWKGLWIDGSDEHVASAKEFFNGKPVTICKHYISRENIKEIFAENNVPKEFDLLSIDIDGNDYWIWQELKEYRPRVVAIEYNAAYLPEENWVMPYNPEHQFRNTAHFGASLRAYKELGEKLGYKLVGCDSVGVNAFFVREDCLGDKFSNASKGVDYHYVSPKYRKLTFGWPRF